MTASPSRLDVLLQGPAGEPVQRSGQVVGCQLDQPVRAGRRGEVGGRRGPAGQPVADPGPRLVAVPQAGRWAFGDDPTGC